MTYPTVLPCRAATKTIFGIPLWMLGSLAVHAAEVTLPFNDDFDDTDVGPWVETGGTWIHDATALNHGLGGGVDGSTVEVPALGGANATAFTVRQTIKIDSASGGRGYGFGLLSTNADFGAANNSYYLVDIANNSLRIVQIDINGGGGIVIGDTGLQTTGITLSTTETYTLKVEVTYGEGDLTILATLDSDGDENGVTLEVTDSTPLTGQHFGIETFGDGGAGVFDDFSIRILGGGSAPPFQFTVGANGDDLVFTWESQAGKVYDLLSSTDPEADGDSSTWPVVVGLEGLAATPPTNTRTMTRPADATRFYVIREKDAPPLPPVFFDDFESVPNPDWTTGVNGGDAGTTVWERGTPINVGPASAYDGSATCFGTNISANYTLGTDIWLRTPPIDLTGEGINGASLSFWQHRDTDLDGQVDDDYGTIRVLDANSFAQLGDPIAAGIEGFDDNGNGPIWVAFEAVALPTEAIGKEVVIEFRFKSDDLASTFAGWYIDDVMVGVE